MIKERPRFNRAAALCKEHKRHCNQAALEATLDLLTPEERLAQPVRTGDRIVLRVDRLPSGAAATLPVSLRILDHQLS